MTGDPAAEDHLRGLEQGLGAPLPASFRAFLTRFGGGLFFHGHEIFGARRVMIHDIELVPDILSIKRRLAAEGRPLPAHLVPFHRARGVVHLLDVGPEGGGEQGRWIRGEIPGDRSGPQGETYSPRQPSHGRRQEDTLARLAADRPEVVEVAPLRPRPEGLATPRLWAARGRC